MTADDIVKIISQAGMTLALLMFLYWAFFYDKEK